MEKCLRHIHVGPEALQEIYRRPNACLTYFFSIWNKYESIETDLGYLINCVSYVKYLLIQKYSLGSCFRLLFYKEISNVLEASTYTLILYNTIYLKPHVFVNWYNLCKFFEISMYLMEYYIEIYLHKVHNLNNYFISRHIYI